MDEHNLDERMKEIVESRMHPIIREEIAHQESQRFRQIKWTIAFVGIVGLGTFGTLANYLIEEAVDSKLETRAGQIEQALNFIKFQALANKIELNSSFSDKDQDAVMGYLRAAATNEKQRHSAEFLAALFQVASSFASASLGASLDEIYKTYSREVLSQPILVEALLHHYGQDLIGRIQTPKKDFSYETFEELERVAESSRVPELALFYRILYGHREAGEEHNDKVAEKIQMLLNLKNADLGRFLRELFQRTIVENWQRDPLASGHQIEQLVRSFISTYKTEFTSHLQMDPELIEFIVKEGIEKDVVPILSTGIVSSLAQQQ